MRTAPLNRPLDDRLDLECPPDDDSRAFPPPGGPSTTPPTRERWRKFAVIAAIAVLLAGAAIALVMLLMPRASLIADSLDAPESIVEGETLEVLVHVRNTGPEDGERDITLLVNGVAPHTVTVALAGEAETGVSFEVAGLTAGTHQLGVEGWSDLQASVYVLTPPEFVLDDVTVIPTEVNVGGELTVLVQYSNIGEASGSYTLRVEFGDRLIEERTVELEGNASGEATFTFPAEGRGSTAVSVNGQLRGIQVLAPEFVLDDVTVIPTEVNVGGELTVLVQYSNIGEASGSYTLRVEFGGRLIEERTVELEGNASGEATFTFPAEGRGSTEVSVNGQLRDIQLLALAEFVINGVDVTPNSANVNALEPVSVVVHLSNIGDVEGLHTVDFMIDDDVVESRSVTLGGGQSVDEQFTFVPDHPGIHVVGVAGQTVELDVYQLERPDNGTVLVNELRGGANRLSIDNQRAEDVLVVLADPADPSRRLLSVYVHAGGTSTVRGIRSGTYSTFYAHGNDWCTFYERFTSGSSYGRFEEDDVFSDSGSTYTIVTVTFGATDGAWSPTSGVDPDDFPR